MDKGMIIRTLVLVIALVNQFLVAAGKSPLPIEDVQIETLVSTVFTVAASMWSWWKNNSVTEEAQAADEYLRELKSLTKKSE